MKSHFTEENKQMTRKIKKGFPTLLASSKGKLNPQ